MPRMRLAAVAMTAATLVASGCGGSSKTGATSPSASTTAVSTATAGTPTVAAASIKVTPGRPLTRTELVAVAGSICKRIDARDALLKDATLQAISVEFPPFASYQRTALAELSKLTPPASMTSYWKQFEAGTHKLAADTTRFSEAVEAKRFTPATGHLIHIMELDEHHIGLVAKRSAITGCERVA